MTAGPSETKIGVKLGEALARLRIAKGAKPQWGLEWSKSF